VADAAAVVGRLVVADERVREGGVTLEVDQPAAGEGDVAVHDAVIQGQLAGAEDAAAGVESFGVQDRAVEQRQVPPVQYGAAVNREAVREDQAGERRPHAGRDLEDAGGSAAADRHGQLGGAGDLQVVGQDGELP